jgi:hypothetical protein
MQTTQPTSNNWAVRFYTLRTGQAFSLPGMQLCFWIAGGICVLMGAFGFLLPEALGMENKKTEGSPHVVSELS